MAFDIQVISVVDDLQVVGVTDIDGAVPRTLRVLGIGGFNSAQRVLINGFGVDSFLVVSDTILLVNPGSSLDNLAVEDMNVVVVSSELTNTRRVRLFFGPTSRLKRVSGLQKLVQTVVKMLLTNTNTNKFRPSEGGDLLQLLAFPLTPSAKPRLTAGLSQAASAIEEQLTTSQATQLNLDPDERLLSLTLGEVLFIPETLEVQATLRLVTFAGNTANVPLVL